MENASKALLIAAAILIAIILITLGIKVLGSADDTAKQAQDIGGSISLATKDSTSKLESLLSGLGGGSSKLNHSGTIPEGGKYISNGITYNAGEKMPSPQTGDVYTYTDYKYTLESDGWKVNIIDKNKESYDDILVGINEKNITSLYCSFKNCTNLTKAPRIPTTVTEMHSAFKECSNLTEAPDIPDSVINMPYTFEGCSNLTKVPDIPDSVTNMYGTFLKCTNLVEVTKISNNVTNMGSAFSRLH